jgi:outer membrane murein-binding lipoprotein Lpp
MNRSLILGAMAATVLLAGCGMPDVGSAQWTSAHQAVVDVGSIGPYLGPMVAPRLADDKGLSTDQQTLAAAGFDTLATDVQKLRSDIRAGAIIRHDPSSSLVTAVNAGGRALVHDLMRFFNDAGDVGLNGGYCPPNPTPPVACG